MLTEELDFQFPPELSAWGPGPQRGEARLIVVRRDSGEITHHKFEEIVDLLKNDEVYVNNSKMLRWRITLLCSKGQKVEADLYKHIGNEEYEAVVKTVDSLIVDPTCAWWTYTDARVEFVRQVGSSWFLKFSKPIDWDKWGTLPLPPHVRQCEADESAFEPIYASIPGSLGSPLAGLHFTEEMLAKLRYRELTLHIDVTHSIQISTHSVEDYEPYMAPEPYNIPMPPAGPVIAVGTTTCKALETYARTGKSTGDTDLYISDPFEFKLTKGLLTSLHRPRETTFALACAFGGRELVQKAYRQAIEKRYQFADYGDVMLIL